MKSEKTLKIKLVAQLKENSEAHMSKEIISRHKDILSKFEGAESSTN